MRLNNRLIVTLPDFASNFSFREFWTHRRQFVRDLNPDKAYYWNAEQKEAFNTVKNWIEFEDSHPDDESMRSVGLAALDVLLGYKLDRKDVVIEYSSSQDFTNRIIRIPAGQAICLPAYVNESDEPFELSIHKIEICGGTKRQTTTISIGNGPGVSLLPDEVLYVTAAGGRFIEFLPNSLTNNTFNLRLINKEGDFNSSLLVQDMFLSRKTIVEGVSSFALLDDGYIYLDRNGCLQSVMTFVSKENLRYAGRPLYVKSDGESVALLYSDGTIRTTEGDVREKPAFRLRYDAEKGLIIN